MALGRFSVGHPSPRPLPEKLRGANAGKLATEQCSAGTWLLSDPTAARKLILHGFFRQPTERPRLADAKGDGGAGAANLSVAAEVTMSLAPGLYLEK